ncbi:MAG: hypothetical protein PHP40_04145 [Eubacteriales bacterium]|nr:hypothetical protein [Eubacteriales bacterium]
MPEKTGIDSGRITARISDSSTFDSTMESRLIVNEEMDDTIDSSGLDQPHAVQGSGSTFRMLLDRSHSPLRQGMIWSEVLGRPVSQRRGRGRFCL